MIEKKSFKKKFASEQELQFKITGRRNKYFGEWASEKLNKKDQEIEAYVNEVMRADLKEPGDMDLIEKVQKDLNTLDDKISIDEIKKLDECFEKAKKDFLLNYLNLVIKLLKSNNKNKSETIWKKILVNM